MSYNAVSNSPLPARREWIRWCRNFWYHTHTTPNTATSKSQQVLDCVCYAHHTLPHDIIQLNTPYHILILQHMCHYTLPDNVHGRWVVFVLVDAHHEHGGISRGGRNDDLLGTPCDMCSSLLRGGEDTSGLHNKLCTRCAPGDGGRVTAA